MILSLEKYKTYKGLTGTLTNEAQLTAVLTAIDDTIKRECNNNFLIDEVETIPVSLELLAVNIVDAYLMKLNNVSNTGNNNFVNSQSFEGNSVSFVSPDAVIKQYIDQNNYEIGKYRKMYPRLY